MSDQVLNIHYGSSFSRQFEFPKAWSSYKIQHELTRINTFISNTLLPETNGVIVTEAHVNISSNDVSNMSDEDFDSIMQEIDTESKPHSKSIFKQFSQLSKMQRAFVNKPVKHAWFGCDK